MKIEDAPFSQLIFKNLGRVKTLQGLYVKYMRFLNYAFVCGVIGVLVNYIVYHLLSLALWEPVAFYVAVGVAALSNYTLTVGKGGYIFGLSKEEKQ